MGAWLLLYVTFGLFAVFSMVFSKVSILGATAAGQLLCLLLPAVLYAKWKSGSAVKGLRLCPLSSGVLWRVTLLALTFIGLGDLLQQATHPLIERYFSNFIPILEALMKLLRPESASGLVGNLLVVALIAPICEEAIFRGAFQGTLEKRGPLRAILASSLVFALVHLNPFDFLTILLIGIALGFVTWRTQSLWPAILWHAVNNTVSILGLYFAGDTAFMPIWLSVLLAVGFFGLAWEFLRYIKKAPPAAPGLLATAPSCPESRLVQVLKVGGLTAMFTLLACPFCFGVVNLGSDFLAPNYTRGDIAAYTRGPAFRSNRLIIGDVIVYRGAAKKSFFTRILAMNGEKITVIGPEADAGERVKLDILREDIKGRIFWKYDPGEQVKRFILKEKSKSSGSRSDLHKPSHSNQNESLQ